jgi:DNA-binding CsgD family transcriptional regulator
MRVFVTGASGWIGSALVPQLIGAGHEVTGLARSDASAAALTEAGVRVHRGDLDDPGGLRGAAGAADGVIHLAFNAGMARSGDFQGAADADRRAVEATGEALTGSDRPLVIASATVVLAPGRAGTEQDAPGADPAAAGGPRTRLAAEQVALSFASLGVRSSVVRLATTCHGDGDRGFLAALVGIARDKGVSGFTSRSVVLLNMGRLAEGAEDGRRALAMARVLGYLAGEGMALQDLGIAAGYSGDDDGAVELIGQQQLITGMSGTIARSGSQIILGALIEAGDLAGADRVCGATLAWCRDTGDLLNLPWMLMEMADLDVQAGRFQDAAAHLREGLQIVIRAGDLWHVGNGLWYCGFLCAATGRHAEAATVWAAHDACARQMGLTYETPADARRRADARSAIRQALGLDRARAAEERGAAMSLDTAAGYALMLTAPAPPPLAAAGPGLGGLSARERELVTLVAQGRTNAQIAAQLYISVRTVGSHLDRIRDKTGCRRRADLTRLALTEGLV